MNTSKELWHSSINEEQVEKIWHKAQIIENLDPEIYRLDNCGALIRKNLYLKGSNALSMAWEIDLIKPLSLGGTTDLSNLQVLQWENKKAKAECFPFWCCVVKINEAENKYL